MFYLDFLFRLTVLGSCLVDPILCLLDIFLMGELCLLQDDELVVQVLHSALRLVESGLQLHLGRLVLLYLGHGLSLKLHPPHVGLAAHLAQQSKGSRQSRENIK